MSHTTYCEEMNRKALAAQEQFTSDYPGACTDCKGTGLVGTGFPDHDTGFPDIDACESCEGKCPICGDRLYDDEGDMRCPSDPHNVKHAPEMGCFCGPEDDDDIAFANGMIAESKRYTPPEGEVGHGNDHD